MINTMTVPAEFGTAKCEYNWNNVDCDKRTNKVALIPYEGPVPMCEEHLDHYIRG